MSEFINLIVSVITLITAYFVGTKVIEKGHYLSLKKRERNSLNLPIITSKNITETEEIKNAEFVKGSVVISIDYFKSFLAWFINIFGGEVSSFETILDRSRREALLRMKESAPNAHIIINARIEMSNIGSLYDKNSIRCSEALAYGTAITFKNPPAYAKENNLVKQQEILSQNESARHKKEVTAKSLSIDTLSLIVGVIILIGLLALLLIK
ncbi:MAG: heavy metal-binding domain-containing protein [Candidatus Omnitrophica bacterium]|nr:heavy metal-binding domain-containing protein [Candidatus Omnitrophota bacterium]